MLTDSLAKTDEETEALVGAEPTPTAPRRIGSLGSWLFARLVQVFLLATALENLLRGNWVGALFFGATLIIVSMWLPSAYGSADVDGIGFRQFLQRRRIPWSDVLQAEWGTVFGPYNLTVLIRHPAHNKKVKFAVMRSSEDWWATLTGRHTPEVVSWVMRQMSIPRGT